MNATGRVCLPSVWIPTWTDIFSKSHECQSGTLNPCFWQEVLVTDISVLLLLDNVPHLVAVHKYDVIYSNCPGWPRTLLQVGQKR